MYSETGGGKRVKRALPNGEVSPKRPACSYLEFLAVRTKAIKEGEPTKQQKDIVKQIGREWKALGPEDKHIYDLRQKDNEVKYREEKQKFDKAFQAEANTKMDKFFPTVKEKPATISLANITPPPSSKSKLNLMAVFASKVSDASCEKQGLSHEPSPEACSVSP
jgi:hypothetical protein